MSNFEYFKKQEDLFNKTTRIAQSKRFKSNVLTMPFKKDLLNVTNLNSLPIYIDEFFTSSYLLNLKNFKYIVPEVSVDNLDDAYEGNKYLNYLYYLSYKNLYNLNINYIQPISYATVLDSYRADYNTDMLYVSELSNVNHQLLFNNISSLNSNTVRLLHSLTLRSTAKNSIVSYNAMQKVFRSRLDEGRANMRMFDLSNSYVNHPFITESRVNYESMLGKNKESFYKVSNYNQYNINNFTDIVSIFNTLNIYTMDLPFLISMKSDPTRYLWFD